MVTFKLDTEAEANVIPAEVFNKLGNTPTVYPTKRPSYSIWWNHNKTSGYMYPTVYK